MSRLVAPAGQPLLTVGRYTLFGEIAKGGMATVHFGRMSSLGGFSKTVAIKRMRKDIALDPEFVAMFLDEARLAARIEHPNVVATLDVVADSGEVFLVMEYVKGETLARLARASEAQGQLVSVPVAASVICGALNGLHAAHEALGESGQPLGIIHRDVSPQNVLVGEDGVARITDFGIAKAETRLQVTHDGQMKGKLGYMAPEQLGGGSARIDRRVDLFTAAIVFWEMLAGRRLFLADTPAETIGNILTSKTPSLCSIRADIPEALDQIVARALSRDSSARPPTAEAFAMAIEEAVDHRLASPRMVGNWVLSLAGNTLEKRTRYVREIESMGAMQSPGAAAARPPEAPHPSAPDQPISQSHQEAPSTGAPRPPRATGRAAMMSQPRIGPPAPPRYPGAVASATPHTAPEPLPPAIQPPAPPGVVPPARSGSFVAPQPIVAVGVAPTPVASAQIPLAQPPIAPAPTPVAPAPAPIEPPPPPFAAAPAPIAPASDPTSGVSSPDLSSSPFFTAGPGQDPSSGVSSPDLSSAPFFTPGGRDPITSGNPLELEARQDSLMPPRRSLKPGLIAALVAGVVVVVIGIAFAVSGGSSSSASQAPAESAASSAPTQPAATRDPATPPASASAGAPAASAEPPPSASAEPPAPPEPSATAAESGSKPAAKAPTNLNPLPPPTKKPPSYLPERP